jgi:signal transduction histidine kinase
MPRSVNNFKFYNKILTGILKLLDNNKNTELLLQNLLAFLGNNLRVNRIFFLQLNDNSNYPILNKWHPDDCGEISLDLGQTELKKAISINKPTIMDKSIATNWFHSIIPECISITFFPVKRRKKVFGFIVTENTSKTSVWSNGLIKTITIALDHLAVFLQNSEIINQIHHRNEQLNDALEEIKEMRTHLVQSERLASVGELARGIAHEINNPMTGILNYAELIKSELPADTEMYHFTNGIIEEGTRIAQIINDLLTFSRYDSNQFHPVAPDQLFNSCLSLVRYLLIKDGITIEKEYPDNLPRVYIIEQQIRQVIINIISNARYALNQKYDKYHENKIMKLNAYNIKYKNKKYIRFEVFDTGIGIPGSYLKKIFDPFFSTKKPNLGVGLGLNIAYNITKHNGGYLSVESLEKEYTRFMLDLPQIVEEPENG